MAGALVTKRQNFISNFTAQVVALLALNDELLSLYNEWNANAFATGASPSGNNIVDGDLTGNLAYLTTAQIDSAIGAVVTVTGSIASNRGYLEAMRP